jgi:hypothetical protein
MAEAPSHRLGQIIGEALESAVLPLLLKFARDHGLYLDRKGLRPCRQGTKLSWTDLHGNTHDLDFVLERGGSDTVRGTPVAFIETAWRRYTKHSRNKAQEIQGAVLPLIETYRSSAPFAGAILAGVFTEGALTQLRSLGFSVVYVSVRHVVEAFRVVGIEVDFDEKTSDALVTRKVNAWERLSLRRRDLVSRGLINGDDPQMLAFIARLEALVIRRVIRVAVLPLKGIRIERPSVMEAILFIQSYDEEQVIGPFVRYELELDYSNGDRIRGVFAAKGDAIRFLKLGQ